MTALEEKLAVARTKAEAEGRIRLVATSPSITPTSTIAPSSFFSDARMGEERSHTVSDATARVNDLWASDAFEVKYDRLVGKERESVTGRGEVKFSCPDPTHPDRHPSASYNAEKGVVTCYACSEGWNEVGMVALALGLKNDSPSDLPVIKRAYAKRVHGFDYEAALAAERATAPTPAPTAPTAAPSSWEAIDLASVAAQLRDGTLERPSPTVGDIEGGSALFYRGKVNGVAGDSNAGKSFTALLACLQEVRLGRCALIVDYEEGPLGTVARLVDMGATDTELASLVYVNPSEAFDVGRMSAVVREREPSIVVIDSTGMSLALDGLKPDADEEVARWFVRVPLFIASLGPAVVILDHLAKDANGAGAWPIGSQRKRAAITGVQYTQRVVKAFSRTTDGYSVLECAKDRHGTYEQGRTVARLEVADAAAKVRFVAESGRASAGLSADALAVVGFVGDHPACTQGEIEGGLALNRRAAQKAIEEAKAAGAIDVRKVGTSHRHYAAGTAYEAEVLP